MKDKIIVATSGTWDLFHLGHSELLRKSKELGDHLIVGIKTDEAVYNQKDYYPIMNMDERIAMLKQCRHVDEVYLQESEDPEIGLYRLLTESNADVFTCGNDRAADVFMIPMLENGLVKARYEIIDSGIDVHSTNIKDRVLNPFLVLLITKGLVIDYDYYRRRMWLRKNYAVKKNIKNIGNIVL